MIQSPVINTNGDSATTIKSELRGVISTLEDSYKLMAGLSAVVHGRNYPNQESQQQANSQNQERIRKIKELLSEMKHIQNDIFEQEQDRRNHGTW